MEFWIALAAGAAAVVVAAVFLRRHARALIRERRIHIDRFKLKSRHSAIESEVLESDSVVAAIAEHAAANGVSRAAAERRARLYLTEIVPKFNLLAYYRIGAPIARLVLNFLYRVVVERQTVRDFNERLPRGAAVVYLINHRSNADYVLVAHMLFKFISLSYAVGEWARVWPLNHLFKWFGAYFIRRRYREPLYHAVLGSFVRTITSHGVTQGVFLEGGLTRDGAFQKPKLGMLDYLVTSKRDPRFTAPLFFVPTAINYDRVMEDRVLTEELLGREERSSKGERFGSLFEFLFKNFWRGLFGRFRRYGYAVVAFSEPILVDEAIAKDPTLLAATFEERKPALQALAERAMTAISDSLPITPVCLVASIFREAEGPISVGEIERRIEEEQIRMSGRTWLTRERSATEIWESARRLLRLRNLIRIEHRGWIWNPEEKLLCDYYANSLMTFDEVKRRGWIERTKRVPSPESGVRSLESRV
jgi:glycerol-3-phosphate O-acyltransferase